MSNQQNRNALFGGKGASTTAAAARPVTSSVTAAAAPAQPAMKTAALKAAPTTSKVAVLSAETKRKKEAEARQLVERANKNLQTSVFQWNPDYLVAGPQLEQAADLYRQIGDLDEAMDKVLKAADCHEKTKAFATTALTLSKASEIAKEMGDQSHCIKLLQRAAEAWGGHGDTTRYGETLSRAAKELEPTNGKRAESLYWKAIEVLCPDDLAEEQLKSIVPPSALEVLRSALTFFLNTKRLNHALRLARKLGLLSQAFDLESSCHKAKLTEVAISLAMAGDPLQSQRLYLDMLSDRAYSMSKEAEIADLLVMAAVNQDSDQLDAARQHPHLMFLDPPLAALIRNLSLLEMMGLMGGDSLNAAGNNNSNNNSKEKGADGLRSQLFSMATAKKASVSAPAAAVVAALAATTAASQADEVVEEQAGEEDEGMPGIDDLEAELAVLDTSFIGDDNEEEELINEESQQQHQPAATAAEEQQSTADEDEVDLS